MPTLDEARRPRLARSFLAWHVGAEGHAEGDIAKLNAAIRTALADPAIQERFKKIGQEIWPVEYQTPDALAAKQKAEIARWTPVIKESGIKAE